MVVKKLSIENILDRCLDQILSGQSTIEDCFNDYPEYATELEEMIDVALLIHSAENIKPSPEFQIVAKTRLINILNGRTAKNNNHEPSESLLARMKDKLLRFTNFPVLSSRAHYASLLMLLLAVVFAVILLTSGVIIASASSVPGDFLHPAKGYFERIQLELSSSKNSRVRLQIKFARERLEEAERLVKYDRTTNLNEIFDDYRLHMKDIYHIMFEEEAISVETQIELAKILERALEENESIFFRIYPNVASKYRESLLNALRLSRNVRISSVMIGYGSSKEFPMFSQPAGSDSEDSNFPTDVSETESDDRSNDQIEYPDKNLLPTIIAERTPVGRLRPEINPENWPAVDDGDWFELLSASNEFSWPDSWPQPPEWFELWLTAQPNIPGIDSPWIPVDVPEDDLQDLLDRLQDISTPAPPQIP
jgi:hypothetical protein